MAFEHVILFFICFQEIRTSPARCSARCFQQDAHDVDLLDRGHRDVDLCLRQDDGRHPDDGRSRDVDRAQGVDDAQAQHNPQASR